MTEFSDWLVRMYAKSLALYPWDFRAEFSDEAQTIFALNMNEAASRGFWELLRFAFRELRDLPLTLFSLYTRERKLFTMQKHLNRWFVQEPGSWAEMLLTSLPFLLMFGVLGLFSSDQMNEVTGLIGIVLLGLAIILLSSLGIIGLLVRLPRWAMPYAGVLITLAVFLVMMLAGLHSLFFSGQMSAPWWLRMVTFEAIYLFALAVTLILFLWLTSRFPLTNSFFAQAQKDWSILSLVMYGGAMTFVLGMYEEIVGAGLYILLTMVPLLVGIWAFLRISGAKGRIAALSVAILVAMGVALIAYLQLMDWVSPLVFKIGNFCLTRSVLSIILTWLLCEAMLFLPMLLQHIPFIKQTQKQAV